MRTISALIRPINWLRAGFVVMAVAMGVALTAPPTSAATRLGGIDLQRYCISTKTPGFDVSRTWLPQNNPYSWHCLDSVWVGSPFGWAQIGRGMDLNHACRIQYGHGAYARLDEYHAYGWRCYR